MENSLSNNSLMMMTLTTTRLRLTGKQQHHFWCKKAMSYFKNRTNRLRLNNMSKHMNKPSILIWRSICSLNFMI